MRNMYFKTPNIGSVFIDHDESLRYLRGKDQEAIKEDDPDFFTISADESDDVSLLSSSRRILKKVPYRHKKEVHEQI